MNPLKAATNLMKKIKGPEAAPAKSEPEHREKYDYAVIRQALLEILSDADLNTLCSTHYGIVHNQFTTGMKKGDKLELLLDHCRQTQGIEELFQHVKRKRSRFAKFEPYCYLERASAGAPGPAVPEPAAESLEIEGVGVNFQHKAEYHNRNILKLIAEAFTPDELDEFIHNSADFQGFESQAARLPDHRAVCRELGLYAQRRLTIDRLLEEIKEHKPDAYQTFKPYVKPAGFGVDAKFAVKGDNERLTTLQTQANTRALGLKIVELLEGGLVQTLGTVPSPAEDEEMACESEMTAAFWVPTYRMDNVRRLVKQAFTIAELERLIREDAAFKNLAGKLPPQPTHNQMLLAQLEYSYNLKRIKALLNLAQVQQPELFQDFQPYYGSAQFVSSATLTVNGDDIRLVDLHKKDFTRALRQRFSETLDGTALQAVEEILS